MSWNHTAVTQALGIQYPIIQAPMAGASPPALVAAVSNAGGLGSLGAALMSADEIAQHIKEIRLLTDKPFSVNLFAYQPQQVTVQDMLGAYQRLQPYYHQLGIMPPLSQALPKIPTYEEQLGVILDACVPVFSFTLGILPHKWIKALKAKKIIVMGTATTLREAKALAESGIDMIVCQGAEAGGHRGSFLSSAIDSLIGLMALVPEVVDAISLPVIASGGIMNGRGIAATMCLGASAVQMGTAFLTTDEANIHPIYKQALLNATDDSTALTRAFTGKYARGIRNRFMQEMASEHECIAPFPYQRALTSKLRKAAEQNNQNDFTPLWAGQGVSLSRVESAGALFNALVAETVAAFKQANG